MDNFDNYIKQILDQILDSFQIIEKLSDTSGDLEILKKEWLKIRGLFLVLKRKIDDANKTNDAFVSLSKGISYYVDNYDFEREIDIMAPLYSEDTNRLKNIRYKIIESLNDKKLIEKIQIIHEDL